MIQEKYTQEEKLEISKQIKNISFDDIVKEMQTLIEIGENAHALSPRARIGNNIVDYFSFSQNKQKERNKPKRRKQKFNKNYVN